MKTALLFSLLAVVLASQVRTAEAETLQVGQPAPAATLVTLDGQKITTQSLRGHTVILTFWASWCEPCREELPLLSKYAQAHKAEGLKVLAFSLDDAYDLQKVRAVAGKLAFPAGLLAQSQAHGYGRMWRIPVSFVIDRHGVLRYNGWKAEQPAWTAASLQQVVGPLLQPPVR